MNSIPLKNKFTCYLIGDDSLLIQCSQILLDEKHVIKGIISSTPKIIKWAAEKNIHCFPNDSSLFDKLSSHSFDYLFSITNLKKISVDILNLPSKSAINFHDGPLPSYAGLNAPSWAILNDEKTYGITWHQMTNKIDEGDILHQEIFDISEDDTAFSLNAKCFEKGISSFKLLIDKLIYETNGTQKQSKSNRSYFGKHQKPENLGIISWKDSAKNIYNLCRALNFGNYPNSLAAAKFKIENDYIIVKRLKIVDLDNKYEPGTIVDISDNAITVASIDRCLLINDLELLNGEPTSVKSLTSRYNLKVGDKLKDLSSKELDDLYDYYNQIAVHEPFWINRLVNIQPINIFESNIEEGTSKKSEFRRLPLYFPQTFLQLFNDLTNIDFNDFIKISFSIFVGKFHSVDNYDIAYSPIKLSNFKSDFNGLFSDYLPLEVKINYNQISVQQIESTLDSLKELRMKGTYINDLISRFPSLKQLPKNNRSYSVLIKETSAVQEDISFNSKLILLYEEVSSSFYLYHDYNSITNEMIHTITDKFLFFLTNLIENLYANFSKVTLVTSKEREYLLKEFNKTNFDYSDNGNINSCLEKQVQRHPNSTALICEDKEISYSELNSKINLLAGYLHKRGIGKNSLVAVSLPRSIEAVVAIFGILKTGAAYVPVDPDFPQARINYMLKDSNCNILIHSNSDIEKTIDRDITFINFNRDWNQIAQSDKINKFDIPIDSLAYMIYTSGSTGDPKGVRINHKNLLNFFSAMDQIIDYDESSVWLAVTSLSFDISILEILWTVLRGIRVVIYTGNDLKSNTKQSSVKNKQIDFGLFYFSSYEGERNNNKYHLLLEGSKFADENNFTAVWTPERHFYDFGGLYPNPSLTSAAVATITSNIQIRAGSVVSPLHNSIRIAEEWSMVDNLSQGRVGVSFAAGWQPDDFVIMPENFSIRKEKMFKQIEEVQSLWKGERIELTNPHGKLVKVRILPRPVQKNLPTWVTAAGNPETFEMAGKLGYNLLTHLLGQSLSELSEKIIIYRKAWKEAGHKGSGKISLMLHTFIGPEETVVKEIVRGPMKEYLKSAVNLVKEAAWSFPTFKNQTTSSDGNFSIEKLSLDELDVVLDYSFERYYQTSGLFGTPESCKEFVNNLKEIEIDEIACLLDFGVDSDIVLEHLHYLNRLRQESNLKVTHKTQCQQYSVTSLIKDHSITHMQCTPSMARMILSGSDSKNALSLLQTLLIGGEIFPIGLANSLSDIINGEILNMYGPTETTIWSTSHKIKEINNKTIPIGKPIANTQIYILDKNLQLVPIGIAGELFIGGDGVADGYHNRKDLTNEKFIKNPFSKEGSSKLYRTGDFAKYREDGTIEYLGRSDDQVKIRGYRIELGEIELVLREHRDIKEAVVLSLKDETNELRLAAYIIPQGSIIDINAVKNYLKEKIPDYMLPNNYISIDKFPVTPNGKLDKLALIESLKTELDQTNTISKKPLNELETQIAEIWKDLLKVQEISLDDNFFDSGGHSLLAVQLHSKIKESLNIELTLIDIFTYPTIRSICDFLNIKMENEIKEIGLPENKRVSMSKHRLSRIRSRNTKNTGE